MKLRLFALISSVIICGCDKGPQQASSARNPQIKPRQGTAEKLMGELGVPLGTVVWVTGKVVTSDRKTKDGKIVFEVSAVDGKYLAQPARLLVSDGYGDVRVEALEKRKGFYAFETGKFVGLPEAAFEHMPMVATEQFHFQAHLFVFLREGK